MNWCRKCVVIPCTVYMWHKINPILSFPLSRKGYSLVDINILESYIYLQKLGVPYNKLTGTVMSAVCSGLLSCQVWRNYTYIQNISLCVYLIYHYFFNYQIWLCIWKTFSQQSLEERWGGGWWVTYQINMTVALGSMLKYNYIVGGMTDTFPKLSIILYYYDSNSSI